LFIYKLCLFLKARGTYLDIGVEGRHNSIWSSILLHYQLRAESHFWERVVSCDMMIVKVADLSVKLKKD
jgi:hypothetical protein